MATRLLRFTWILLVVIAVLLLSCTDNLLGKMKSNIQVSLDIPEVPRSRNVSTSLNLDLKVKGWVQDKQGEVLDLVEKTLENGRAVLSFNTVDVGLEVQVLIQISDTSQVLYSGRSDFFEVSPEGNTVSVDLKRGDFSSEEVTGPAGDGGKDDPAGSDGPTSDGGEDAPAGSDGPPSDGDDNEPTDDGDENGAPSGGDGNESAGDGGSVGTVEVNFTVKKADWENLINFPSSNDLYIASAILSSDNVVQGESYVSGGDFGDNTITISNIPANTEVKVSVGVLYNPGEKYTYEELTSNTDQMSQYILHMDMSDSFVVNEGANTVKVDLFPYEFGNIFQNGYAYSCSNQEEIENIITHAPTSAPTYISLENNVLVTETITINKDISFMPRGDIITIGIAGSFLRAKNITGPMFEVTTVGSLDLEGFSLDGQEYTGDSPLIVSEGDLTLGSCELINYNCSSTNQGVVYVTKGSVSISYTNITVAEGYDGNALYMESGVTYDINGQKTGLEQSYKSITSENP